MPNHSTERFQFMGKQGNLLDARLERPVIGGIRAVALFAHCFTCTKDSHAATRLTSALADRGFAVLRFDFTGLGGSEGEFANSGFVANIEDLIAASNHLRKTLMAPAVLIGHSLGGAAVIAAAEHIPEAKAVVTIGAPFEVSHVLHLLGDGLEKVEDEGEAELTIGGRPFKVSREFVGQTKEQPQGERLANLDKALLVMHAPEDTYVGIENATEIFIAAKHPKSFVSLDNADHLLTDSGSAEYAAGIIAAWAQPYLGSAMEGDERPLLGTIAVRTASGKFTQTVSTPNHEFVADEPKSFGGDDLGPNPYELMLAGLGACTSMTIKMYADRKKIPLQEVRVVLEHSREHADDCQECETSNNQIDVIDKTVQLTGDLSNEQRQKLLEIADKCPVHKTLNNTIKINSMEVT